MTDQIQNETKKTDWHLPVRIAGVLVAIFALLGGGYFYEEIYKSKILTYTLLPGYDVEDQYFTGLIIENRGRVSLNDLDIILTDLKSKIEKISMPGPHQPVEIISGGVGKNEIHLRMPDLYRQGSLPIYMITSGPIEFVQGNNLFIASAETVGKENTVEGPSKPTLFSIYFMTFLVVFSNALLIYMASMYSKLRRENSVLRYNANIRISENIAEEVVKIKSSE